VKSILTLVIISILMVSCSVDSVTGRVNAVNIQTNPSQVANATIVTPQLTETPASVPTTSPTPHPSSTQTTSPTSTLTPTQTPLPTITPQPTFTQTTIPALSPTSEPSLIDVMIVTVDKRAEYVDIQNMGDTDVDLTGWSLVSEKGHQACTLSGIIEAGEILRIWSMTTQGEGYSCGYNSPIWNNSEPDPAVLYNAQGVEISRK
jgi:hypothetical protein